MFDEPVMDAEHPRLHVRSSFQHAVLYYTSYGSTS